MLLLAVKLGLLTSVNGQLSNNENATWQGLRNSIATLGRNGVALGPAVFISPSGYAVANTLVVEKGATDLVTSSGLTYKFKIEATDSASQLTLLKTSTPPVGVSFVRVADRSDGEKGNILAVLPRQVLRAELTSREKIGLDEKTKRTFPIQEVRIEQPALQMGGALLFSQSGRLIGGLSATLAQDTMSAKAIGAYDTGNNRGQGGGAGGPGGPGFQNQSNIASRNYGPQGLVVGYVPTWEVTSKAITGFLSPGKKAQYGVIGVFVIDNKFGGVEITSINKDSSADSGGLEVGDVILDINGVLIQNQIDFSRATYRMIPGGQILVKVRRKIEILTFKITVGSQLALADVRPQSSTAPFGSLGTR